MIPLGGDGEHPWLDLKRFCSRKNLLQALEGEKRYRVQGTAPPWGDGPPRWRDLPAEPAVVKPRRGSTKISGVPEAVAPGATADIRLHLTGALSQVFFNLGFDLRKTVAINIKPPRPSGGIARTKGFLPHAGLDREWEHKHQLNCKSRGPA